jgi:hypothetical protein
MLIVMEQSLQAKVHPGSELAKVSQAMANAAWNADCGSVQSAFLSMPVPLQYDRMLDEESTEADGSGAFSCLLSTPSPRTESVDALDANSEFLSLGQDLEQASDSEKSNMVCRHWKTKGWCRMESSCKFLHLEHKRGIASAKAGKTSSTHRDISGIVCPSMSATDIVSTEGELYSKLVGRRNRRGGKNRANRCYQGQLSNAEQDVTGLAPFLFHAHSLYRNSF